MEPESGDGNNLRYSIPFRTYVVLRNATICGSIAVASELMVNYVRTRINAGITRLQP